ncbi:DUF2267 domain-containing protein [Vreelandella massiliensis]|uniref:DUF2267 domain-containing protein n=1 Tax=Vreelandella massiliensis TaxID=1816686 RepID=UPI00096A83D6|nr:DUF2267 domain-containing protein [Halomonas massiliensis]MYL24777.1 DUF2267 domain-containing protein [Halomonas alkaliantarctica]
MTTPHHPHESATQASLSGHAETTYYTFISELCAPGDMSRGEAECATVAVLRTLEERIQPAASKTLEAQLPDKLQTLLDHCQGGKARAPERFGKDTFIARVAEALETTPTEAESIAQRVFATLRSQISDGEVEDVASQLPPDIERLWRAS